MQEANRLKLGLFVCSAFLLLIGIMVFLGMLDRFKEKAQVMTMVSESVQGLTPGSNVKFQGVPIGKVTDITIETETRLIRIDMEINLSKIRLHPDSDSFRTKPAAPDEFYANLEKQIVQDNLCCMLESEGITGMKYIEFEYSKDSVKPLMKPGFSESGVFYVPSVPSLMSDLRASVTSILEKLQSVDYQGISKKITTTLDSADKLLNDPKFQSILKNFDEASAGVVKTVNSLNQSITKERIQELMNNSDRAMKSIQDLSALAGKEIKSAEIGKTSEHLRISLDSFRNSNVEFSETLNRFNDGIDALVELVQFLDSDPASLIRGKVHLPAGKENR